MFWMAILMQAAMPHNQEFLNEGDIRQALMMNRAHQAAAIEQARTMKPDALERALLAALSDRTVASFDEGTGIVIVHYAPDGRLISWYPAAKNVAQGQWGIRRFKKKAVYACTRQGSPSPNETPFDPTECALPEDTLAAGRIIREWRGDVFHLARGQVPFVREAMSLPLPTP